MTTLQALLARTFQNVNFRGTTSVLGRSPRWNRCETHNVDDEQFSSCIGCEECLLQFERLSLVKFEFFERNRCFYCVSYRGATDDE